MLEEDFVRFCHTMTDPTKGEHFLPNFVDCMIHENRLRVKVLPSSAKWHGVTYREDAEALRRAIAELYRQGVYTERP
jgi:hypothetical protein